jgi:hypothetical protein
MTYLYALFVMPILIIVGIIDAIFRLILGDRSGK